LMETSISTTQPTRSLVPRLLVSGDRELPLWDHREHRGIRKFRDRRGSGSQGLQGGSKGLLESRGPQGDMGNTGSTGAQAHREYRGPGCSNLTLVTTTKRFRQYLTKNPASKLLSSQKALRGGGSITMAAATSLSKVVIPPVIRDRWSATAVS